MNFKMGFYQMFFRYLLVFILVLLSSITKAQTDYSLKVISSVDTKNGLHLNLSVESDSNDDLGIILKYIHKDKLLKTNSDHWMYSNIYDIKDNSLVVSNFNKDENYIYYLGIVDKKTSTISSDDVIAWSTINEYNFDTRWSIGEGISIQILALLGALGLFIFGMKTMSDGIQKGFGSILRNLIGGMTSNRANGIFYGFITTSLVQSSSATTVMVVSFVNNGILSLKQSIAVIMGANIGTTITAWLIAYFGFKSFMPDYALIIFLLAIIFLFSAKSQLRPWGEILTGIALLFFGLEFLNIGIPNVSDTIEQFQFLNNISGVSIWNVTLAVLIGGVITVVFQSSIAALVLTILLCAKGIVPYEMGLGMVLGSNLGTTITANIAAIAGNVHAKRAARAHLVFNFFGVIWMIIFFPYFINFLNWILVDLFNSQDPMAYKEARPIALALFHTLFNIINATILYFFIDSIASIVVKIVPTNKEDDEVFQLGYIKAGMLATPEITIIEAKKEIARFGKITSKMSNFFQQLLVETDKKKKKYLYDKIEKYEDITDRVELELTNYLSQTSENDLSDATSKKVRSMLAITNYLERIGDLFYQMSITIQRKEKEKIWFSPDQRQNLLRILELVDEAFVIMTENLTVSSELIALEKALKKEAQINELRNDLRAEHFENVERQEYNIKSGIIYSDLFYSCEKIGDHIMNITEALVDEESMERVIDKIKSDKVKES